MESSIFRYAWRYSKRQQIMLLTLIACSMPFYYFALDLPKIIIDRAIQGTDFPKPLELNVFGFGIPLGTLDQFTYLGVLCALFLIMVVVNGGFKFQVKVFQGVLGERMLRRLRYDLLDRSLRFPLPHFRKISGGEIIVMVNAETEPLGGYIGESIATPAFEGGLLLVNLAFIFAQDPILGTAAIALYPLQAWLIPKLQRRVNQLGKERVRTARQLSDRIGEIVAGIQEVHANDTGALMRADYAMRLGRIFFIRVRIYNLKFFIKFLNNFISDLTPFFFYGIGGYLAIQGQIEVGALVAILNAYKNVQPQWKELLDYYQRKEDARIKYEQIIEQFQPEGMLPPDGPHTPAAASQTGELNFTQQIVASNLSWFDEDGPRGVEGASVLFNGGERVAIVGPGGSGKDILARMIAGILRPTGGRLTIGDRSIADLPESVTGRRIAYVSSDSFVFSGTIRDNLFLGLRNQQIFLPDTLDYDGVERDVWMREAETSGNSTEDPRGEWIDFKRFDAEDIRALVNRSRDVLRMVDLERDLFQLGLYRVIEPNEHPGLVEGFLDARAQLRAMLADDPSLATFVELFDPDSFNANASVARNMLFGTPLGPAFDYEGLAKNAFVRDILDRARLTKHFLEGGRTIASVMVELFRDLPPGHEFFEQYSFINHDDLPILQSILRRTEKTKLSDLGEEDRLLLLSLPFKVAPARHRLGIFDQKMQDRVIEARRMFAAELPSELADQIEFFHPDQYNSASTVLDNILFGRIAFGRAGAEGRVREAILKILDDLGLTNALIELALDSPVGVAGSRLGAAQRQKLAFARALMKEPDLVIVNEGLNALDRASQDSIRQATDRRLGGKTLIWIEGQLSDEESFDRAFFMQSGKIVEQRFLAEERANLEGASADDEAGAERTAAGQDLEEDEDIQLLRQIPFFANLDRSHLKLLAATCEKLQFPAGTYIFHQGERADSMYVLVNGEAEIIVSEGGTETALRRIGRNQVVGEIALLTDETRSASIRAVSDLEAIRLTRETFVELVKDRTDISFQLIQQLAKRLFDTTKRYETVLEEQRKAVNW